MKTATSQWYTVRMIHRRRAAADFTGRKVKGTIHWVSAPTAGKVECRLYENIVDEEKGKLNADGTLNLNPNSKTITTAYVEPKTHGSKGIRQLPVHEKRLLLRRLQGQQGRTAGI